MKKRTVEELLLTPKIPYLYGSQLEKVHMCYEDCDHMEKVHMCYEDCDHIQPERLSEKTSKEDAIV